MALGASINANRVRAAIARLIAPLSISSNWQTLIDAGASGPQVADAATITNPTTQITASSHHIIKRNGLGTKLALRLGYDASLTVSASPVVNVFGRTGSDVWQPLRNIANTATTGTITAASTTDVTDGTLKYTTVDTDLNVWDCQGCDEILVGVQTALNGTGTLNNSKLQGRIY